MNFKFTKKILAAVFTLSCILIPTVSNATFVETELANLDFSNVSDGGPYTLEEIKTLTGETDLGTKNISGLTTSTVWNINSGVANIDTSSVSQLAGITLTNSQAVETGCIEYLVKFNYGDLSVGNSNRKMFVVNGANGKERTLIVLHKGEYNMFSSYGATDGVKESVFCDTTQDSSGGTNKYYDDYTSRNHADIKIYIYRSSNTAPWTVKMHDVTAGADSSKIIMITSLPAADYPSISSVSAYHYDSDSTQGHINIRQIRAKLVSMDNVVVKATLPQDNTIGTLNASFKISFDSPIDPTTLSNVTFAASDSINKISSVTPAADNMSAIFTLNSLTDGTPYTLNVPDTVLDQTGNAIQAASKTITADVEKNWIFKADFTNATDGTYTGIADIKSIVGESQLFETPADVHYTVENGKVSISKFGDGYAGVLAFGAQMNVPITHGCVEVVAKFTNAASGPANDYNLMIISPTGDNYSFATCMRANPGKMFAGSEDAGYTGEIFENGENYYSTTSNDIDLKLIFKRENSLEDWEVKVFDISNPSSASTPILTTTLASAEYPSISKIQGQFYTTDGTNFAANKLVYNTLSARYLEETPPTLEDDAISLTEDVVVNYSEAVTPTAAAQYVIKKVSTGYTVPAEASWSSDKQKLTIVPLELLENGEGYTVTVSDVIGESCITYDNTLTFTVETEENSLVSSALSYTDVNGDSVLSQSGATSVSASVSVSNPNGASLNIIGVLGVYNSGGRLENIKVVELPQTNNTIIPVTIPLVGTEDLAGKTIKTFIFNNENGKISSIK